MKLQELIEKIRQGMDARLAERGEQRKIIDDIREACSSEERDPSADEAEKVTAARAKITEIDADLEQQKARKDELEAELAADEAALRLAREVNPGAPMPAYDDVVRTGQEKRTYNQGEDPKGVQFFRDVALQFTRNDMQASGRLARHMDEERVEREGQLIDRATGTANFSGLVVPQYLTDLMAPHAKAGRPFADACRHHDLPAEGMTVEISKITTGTDADEQTTQNTAVTEQDMDDTQLSVPVKTVAGQQTIARQAVERGRGIDDTTYEDLARAYGTRISKKLLNDATTGATNVATTIAYTDATPTAPELYPKTLQGPSQVEAALLDMDAGDCIAVMHSRRWYWLQAQLSSTWPTFGQPSVPVQLSGVNYGEKYGSGFRGVLPNGTPVIVDNNIATNLGAGTNEDEIYFGAQSEFHLWEDPNAPMLIRAEEAKAATLSILLVVYGYFAYTFTRRAHAQKIAGTGLITPTF